MGLISGFAGSSVATEFFTRSISSIGSGSEDLKNIINFDPKNYLLGYLFNNKEDTIKIRDVNLQTSTYGRIIPKIFGTTTIAGNIIWSSDIVTQNIYNQPQIGKSFSSQGSYSTKIRASFAIAICEGPISSINAIYADNELLNQANYNIDIYIGDNKHQNPTLVSHLGKENVPIMNKIVYVVFTDFPLEKYNGRIPNFTFSVTSISKNNDNINNHIEAINVIPGSGEFVYDTNIQYKLKGKWINGSFIETSREVINSHVSHETNSIQSLNDLTVNFPNLKWVSVVVNWFTNSTNAQECEVYPAVEFKDSITYPEEWSVGRFTRKEAKEVGKDASNNLRYGGTPSDNSLIRYVNELKKRGLKVCIYPMLMVDTNQKPWRGRIEGKTKNGVINFFNQYSKFIEHYAFLLKDKIDAIIIGSEFVELTSFRDENKNYTAVNELIKITQSIKQIVGNNTLTIYAADWTEYHHDRYGTYNMDKLWASKYLDIIGIDAYFPLSKSSKSIYSTEEIISGWSSGEGYDFYYQDSQNRINPQFLGADWAWKNIEHFWANYHYKSDGTKTEWIPKSKPIWFTEYGFPSVDCCTNQPNVFYSPTSSESAFPFLSSGIPDFKAQETAILGTELKWKNSEVVGMKFLYAWDARPYPAYPALTEIWKDCDAWEYGHFVNGKIGNQNLGKLISEIMILCGIEEEDFDSSLLNKIKITGHVIDTKARGIDYINTLAKIFNFDICFENGKIIFKHLDDVKIYSISESDLIQQENNIYIKKKSISINDIPSKVEVIFTDINRSQAIGSVQIFDESRPNNVPYTVKIPIAMSANNARQIGWQILQRMLTERTIYTIVLGFTFLKIKVLDKIKIQLKNEIILIQVNQITILPDFQIQINGISTEEQYNTIGNNSDAIIENISTVSQIPNTNLQILDIQNFTNTIRKDLQIYFAIYPSLSNWKGCSLYISDDNENNYKFFTNIISCNIIGIIPFKIKGSSPFYIDNLTKITVIIPDPIDTSNFKSTTYEKFLQLNQIGLFGKEIIVFQNVKEIDKNTFEISNLIRGQFGTEKYINSHTENEKFTLLDLNMSSINLPISYIGKTIFAKAVSFDQNINDCDPISITIEGNNLKNPDVLNYEKYQQANGDIILQWFTRSSFLNKNINIQSDNLVFIKIISNNKIIKSITTNENQYLYTKEEQVKDNTVGIDFKFCIENIIKI